MASCCPNKKGLTCNEQPSVDVSSYQWSTGNSVPSQDPSEKNTDNGLKIGLGKGIDFKSTTGYPHRIPKLPMYNFVQRPLKDWNNQGVYHL